MSAIGFIPQGQYLVLAIPASVYETSIAHLNEASEKSFREQKTREYVEKGSELIVAEIGEHCTFIKRGDKVLVGSHARLQKIEIDGDENSYFVIREGDILGKLDPLVNAE